MRTIHSSFCSGFSHAPWSLKRASSFMMSHSLGTHAVILTVFNLVSTTPRFHHPLCLRARPLTLTSQFGASSSIPSSASGSRCSFLLRLAFPQKTVFPMCSNPLGVQSILWSFSAPHNPVFSCLNYTFAFLSPLFTQAIPQEDSWSLLFPPDPDCSSACTLEEGRSRYCGFPW